MAIKDERGQFQQRTEEDKRKAWQDFYFAIEPGSSLPMTRVQRAMMKFQLVQLGALPMADILEELAIDNPQEKMQQAKDEKEAGFGAPENGKKSGTGNLDKVLSGLN